MQDHGPGGGGVSGRVNRIKERMYWRTACWSSAGSTFFQAGMAVRGFPWAMVRSSSVSVLAEVAAEMRLPGRGDRNGA